MSIFGQTKGTEIEKQIAQLSSGEATGEAMYYALAYIAKEKFGLDDVAKEFIDLGNQETNHGAFYALLNGRYPNKLQEKHHGEVTQAIIDKYAPKEDKENTNKPVYVCSVCGFEYTGDLDKEPDDYKCPICGCAKGVFKKQ